MPEFDRSAWLEQRRSGVGASEVAALCGLSPYADQTPLAVYLDKLGQLPSRHSEAMSWGTRLEPLVADAYSEETGHELFMPNPPIIARGDAPHHFCTPDRLVCGHPIVIEIKTASTSQGWGIPGTDVIPSQYLVQVQWQLWCLAARGITEAHVAVLIGGNRLAVYRVLPHADLQTRLAGIVDAFWDRVQRRDPPPIGPAPADRRLYDLLVRPQPGEVVDLPDPLLAELACHYRDLGKLIGQAEDRRAEVRLELVQAMGTAAVARLADGITLRRTVVTVRPYEVPGRTDVRLTVSIPDPEENHERTPQTLAGPGPDAAGLVVA